MNRVIAALDNMSARDALLLVRKTRDHVWGYKVNDLLVEEGTWIITQLKQHSKVMADPKLYDIPNTNKNSLEKLLNAGANLVTVHCSAQYVPNDVNVAKSIAGITILTNFTNSMCLAVYGKNIKAAVLGFAEWANDHKYGYLVCSAKDLEHGVKNVFSDVIITPAIRPEWSIVEGDDQERITTPRVAFASGADLLVIGRPITQAENPVEALERTNEEILKVEG